MNNKNNYKLMKKFKTTDCYIPDEFDTISPKKYYVALLTEKNMRRGITKFLVSMGYLLSPSPGYSFCYSI